MFDDPPDPFLTVEEAASVLRMAERTLGNHRSRKTGPEFRRHGGRIVYRLSDLLAWSDQRAVRTTRPRRGRTPPSEETEHDGNRTSRAGLAEDGRPNPSVEREPKHPDRPLPGNIEQTGKRDTGDHPPY